MFKYGPSFILFIYLAWLSFQNDLGGKKEFLVFSLVVAQTKLSIEQMFPRDCQEMLIMTFFSNDTEIFL